MLNKLHIKNLAVIDEAEIDFESGFNVLTGETGAGKSIIIDSISMLSGGRANRELVRSGEKKAVISGMFTIDTPEACALLERFGIDADGGQLIVRREITAEGKNVCRINGQLVPLNALKRLGEYTVSIHGQQDSQTLTQPSRHTEYLDRYGDYRVELQAYAALYEKTNALKKAIRENELNQREKLYRIDMLTYHVGEIDAADLKRGEEEFLQTKRDRMLHAERIAGGLNAAYTALFEGRGSAYECITVALRRLNEVSGYDASLSEYGERLENIRIEAEDIAYALRDYANGEEYEDGNLDDVEARLDVIHRLKRKYGDGIDGILKYRDEAVEELERITHNEELLERLNGELSESITKQTAAAAELTRLRLAAAERLSGAVTDELRELDMKRVKFKVCVTPCDMNSNGAENVEFLISTNPGEPLKPLSKIASGGELSRVMLSIKSVLTDAKDADTLIFDEIDAGVSGRAALKIAAKLASISRGKQILCITHLAQIAASADHHLLIEKQMRSDSTRVSVTHLTQDERVAELARIIGGVRITDTTLAGAREMLVQAGSSHTPQ